ncbi:MAG: HNH endonuclease [Pseudomonadota bacterium]
MTNLPGGYVKTRGKEPTGQKYPVGHCSIKDKGVPLNANLSSKENKPISGVITQSLWRQSRDKDSTDINSLLTVILWTYSYQMTGHPSEMTKCITCGTQVWKDWRKKTVKCRKCHHAAIKKDPTLHGSYKTGKHLDSRGYITIVARDAFKLMKNGRVFEHRYLMEKHLGRRLRGNEHVHHINGIKTDNRFENLQLMNARSHLKLHHPVKFDKCIVCGNKRTKSTSLKRGLCSNHYQQFMRKLNPNRTCILCDARHYAKGLCIRHYDISRK